MKICTQCKEEWSPSAKDRHKVCNICRNKNYREKCACGKSMQRKSSTCHNCHNKKGLSAKPEGHKFYHKKGYKLIKVSNHPRAKSNNFVFEHIVVMEKYLDRYLKKGENIHHLNGIKDDNRIENLELWIKPQPTGIRAKDAVKWAKEILERYENI